MGQLADHWSPAVLSSPPKEAPDSRAVANSGLSREQGGFDETGGFCYNKVNHWGGWQGSCSRRQAQAPQGRDQVKLSRQNSLVGEENDGKENV